MSHGSPELMLLLVGELGLLILVVAAGSIWRATSRVRRRLRSRSRPERGWSRSSSGGSDRKA